MQTNSQMKLNRESLAMAAGFFNGEGSTSGTAAGSRRRRIGVRLSIGQCTRWELDQFRTAVGGLGRINGPYARKIGADRWVYRVNGWQLVQAIIAMMWPWLSPSKKIQATKRLVQYRGWALTNLTIQRRLRRMGYGDRLTDEA